MLTPLDFLSDLVNPALVFLPKALLVSMLAAVVCGVIGSHVVLRGMTFIGDAVAHSVFPGIAVAFVLQGSLVLGGIIAGLVTAIIIALFSQMRRLGEDSVIGIFFVAAFALGVVVISLAPGYAGSLTSFLFGSITGIPTSTVWMTSIMSIVVLTVTVLFHKELVTVSLDRDYARAIGMKVLAFDILLYVLVTLAVVMSIQTIGNVLVIALLVSPAAAARMLCDRLVPMMLTSATIGGLGALAGLYFSWEIGRAHV